MAIKVGCCGFPMARRRYFEQFSTVEIQQTFYRLPAPSTAHKWREEAPEGFEFTAKAWQLITHEPTSPTYRRLKKGIPEHKRKNYGSFKPTVEVFEVFEATKQFCRSLGTEKIIFQCPPSFGMTSEHMNNIVNFFGQIDRKDFMFNNISMMEDAHRFEELVRSGC